MLESTQPNGLADTIVFRHFGARGLTLFGRIYFPSVLAVLLLIVLAFLVTAPSLPNPQRSVTLILSTSLAIFAAYRVLCMRRGFFAELSAFRKFLDDSRRL